jgi:hypothetical protein
MFWCGKEVNPKRSLPFLYARPGDEKISKALSARGAKFLSNSNEDDIEIDVCPLCGGLCLICSEFSVLNRTSLRRKAHGRVAPAA